MSIIDLQKQAKTAFDHAVAKKNLKERIESRLTVTHRGGVFRVNTDLFVLLDLHEDDEWNDEMILLDAYDTPVMVDRKELRNTAKQRYTELMNEWLAEWNKLKQTRRVENV
jgi:hypothetical protein